MLQKIIFVQKNLCSEEFLSPRKIVGQKNKSKIILGLKISGPRMRVHKVWLKNTGSKMLGKKKGPRNFWVKKISGPLIRKNLGQKNFGSKKFLSKKFAGLKNIWVK